MDQRSTVPYLHLKRLLAHAIHDDLVATLGSKAVAFNTVTRDLREAKLSTAEVTLDPKPSSPHLDDSDPALLAALEEKKNRFRLWEHLPEPPMPHALRSIEDSQNRSGS
jgi:hypothetical protein